MAKQKFKIGDKVITQVCRVKIRLGKKEPDYYDIDLDIEFLDGLLKGEVYHIDIDINDFHEVEN